ncbi:guanylate-binding protein 1-like isoform X2 [Sceloporus undulatus]|uniref:guanylate-binding protein 1-like isoform X2 n=1 Tax=Sceloporus undulatus TaxID=8520 RepID=UPI001C4BD1CB|nr:guanylate-binding protein 1-like isoform X2 [Sceloporus undulatus]
MPGAVRLAGPCLRLEPSALALLRGLPGPLRVVGLFGPQGAQAGLLRALLAGAQPQGPGGPSGPSLPPPPGLWLQGLPHPTRREEGTLVLLHAEGEEGSCSSSSSSSSRLFCLSVLLCTVFVYNSRGGEQPQRELDRLACVRDLVHRVRVLEDCPQENSFLLSSVLPDFVWCLHDVAPDTVWEEMLRATDHDMETLLASSAASEEDSPSRCIQRLFPSQKAFCFRSPAVDEGESEFLPRDQLHPVFQKQLEVFRDYILSREPKRDLSGEVLSDRLEQFVAALSHDQPILLSEIYWCSQAASSGQCPHIPQSPPASPSTSQASIMEAPICLIENNPREQLQINPEALGILQSIHQPVVVVAIVGLYRTGKSYLMNRLAGKDTGGFALGATVQASTKGIWMWCCPHPLRPDHTLVLLDTEGLGDVEKSNTENDTWIFALSILLSSTFVYNSMSTINHHALEQIHYVTELTEHIKMRASGRETCERWDGWGSNDLASVFPAFIWVVRDFTLQLKLEDGRSITEDEYLEKALERRAGTSEKWDLPKRCIREFFPSRKCFVFDRPASRQDLQHLEDLPESKLSLEFLQQARNFCRYIHESAGAKVLQGGHVVTGTLLGTLVETYVGAIRNKEVPCIENAVLALAKLENSTAICKAVQRYEEMLELMRTVLPTEDMAEVLAVHARCEEEAIRVFMGQAFRDKDQKFQRQLADQLQLKLKELCQWNEEASLDRCQAILMELYQEMEEKISHGDYLVPGGYQQFLNDQQHVMESYHLVPDKGLMASKALQDFLASQETTAQSILQADQALKEKEKELEVEKAQAEASRREAELQREMQARMEQMAREKERSFQEHKQQLIAKMEADQRALLAGQERLLNQKLQEQRRLQEEDFQQEVSRMQKEVHGLKAQIREQGRSRCTIA